MTAESMEHAVLRVIAGHGDNYALGLMELLNVGQSIYGTLHALERDGLLESYPRDHRMPQRGGRPRFFYRLTDKARARLRAEAITRRRNVPMRLTRAEVTAAIAAYATRKLGLEGGAYEIRRSTASTSTSTRT